MLLLVKMMIKVDDQVYVVVFNENWDYFDCFCYLLDLMIVIEVDVLKLVMSGILVGVMVYILMVELVDLDEEWVWMEKEIIKLEKEVVCLIKKLGNEKFVNSVFEQVVVKEWVKVEEW